LFPAVRYYIVNGPSPCSDSGGDTCAVYIDVDSEIIERFFTFHVRYRSPLHTSVLQLSLPPPLLLLLVSGGLVLRAKQRRRIVVYIL
jgi:hypothetical protein